mgnify:CR=1 FL=1
MQRRKTALFVLGLTVFILCGTLCTYLFLPPSIKFKLQYRLRNALGKGSTEYSAYRARYAPLLELTDFNIGNFLKYDQAVLRAAYQHELDPDLIRAVILVESKFEVDAVSHRGAVGLMQVMPATGRSLGYQNIRDPDVNLKAGAHYLRRMLDTFDQDMELALAAYNAGPGAVKRSKGIPPYPETQNYVTKVLAAKGRLQGLE